MRAGPARFAFAWIVLVAIGRLDAQESPPSARSERENPRAEAPGRWDAFFRTIDPSRLQHALDGAIGLDPDGPSELPRAPEIGEPVFFDLVRPLGDLKYGSELNYLYNSSTRNVPTLQVIEYEYTFADWRTAELDLFYFNGNLEILAPFYQRTLGVGRRGNWVHGYQVSPDLYLRSGFVGGTAVYEFAWKPEKESRFSSLIFLGANRALINGFHPTPPGDLRVKPAERVFGAWRPTVNVDVFYKLSEKFTIGFEADHFLQRGLAAEFVDFPFLTYEPGEHAFFQVGGGYYRFESRNQFTFFVHLNFVNPSHRKPRDEKDERAEPDTGTDGPGPIREVLSRLFGRR